MQSLILASQNWGGGGGPFFLALKFPVPSILSESLIGSAAFLLTEKKILITTKIQDIF